jgi:hypothetical protein
MTVNMEEVRAFLVGPDREQIVNIDVSKKGRLRVRARKATHCVAGHFYKKTFDLRAIAAEPTGRGIFTDVIEALRHELEGSGFDALFAEGVGATCFQDHLRRNGWIQNDAPGLEGLNFVLPLTAGEPD